jgi:hypothetical protein
MVMWLGASLTSENSRKVDIVKASVLHFVSIRVYKSKVADGMQRAATPTGHAEYSEIE